MTWFVMFLDYCRQMFSIAFPFRNSQVELLTGLNVTQKAFAGARQHLSGVLLYLTGVKDERIHA